MRACAPDFSAVLSRFRFARARRALHPSGAVVFSFVFWRGRDAGRAVFDGGINLFGLAVGGSGAGKNGRRRWRGFAAFFVLLAVGI